MALESQDKKWQLTHAIDAVVFDCDGTMSQIEGICWLAQQNQAGESVQALTEMAMAKTGITVDLYEQRLDQVKPTHQQLIVLGHQYYQQRSHHLLDVLDALRQVKKVIYVVSAGLNPSVQLFAAECGIPEERVFAVDCQFDSLGQYIGFDRQSPMTKTAGKKEVIRAIMRQHPRVAFIGDGMNDMAAKDLVTRFIGYGGAFFRNDVASLCDFYINTPSLSPILPLCMTVQESQQLDGMSHKVFQKGLEFIRNNNVNIK